MVSTSFGVSGWLRLDSTNLYIMIETVFRACFPSYFFFPVSSAPKLHYCRSCPKGALSSGFYDFFSILYVREGVIPRDINKSTNTAFQTSGLIEKSS